MDRKRFSLEEGLVCVSNEEIIAIMSDANLASLRNIKDIDDRSKAIISELIATLCCWLAGVVYVQS